MKFGNGMVLLSQFNNNNNKDHILAVNTVSEYDNLLV